MTENTFNALKDNIVTEINTVRGTKTENDLNYLCDEIYKIVSSNILYSNIYAKLYSHLILNFAKFNDLLFKYFDKVLSNSLGELKCKKCISLCEKFRIRFNLRLKLL